MCNVKYLVDLNPKESGERSRNGSGTTLNLDFGFCNCHGEMYIYDGLDILFPSNHNIHKSSCDLYFWASDP